MCLVHTIGMHQAQPFQNIVRCFDDNRYPAEGSKKH